MLVSIYKYFYSPSFGSFWLSILAIHSGHKRTLAPVKDNHSLFDVASRSA